MSYESKGTPIEAETATPGPGDTVEARSIGPHGPTGPMHTVDVDYMQAIGPRGATGPLIPLGGFVSTHVTPVLLIAVIGWTAWKLFSSPAPEPIRVMNTANGAKGKPWSPKSIAEARESLEIIRMGAHCGEQESVEAWLGAIEVKYPSLMPEVRKIRGVR